MCVSTAVGQQHISVSPGFKGQFIILRRDNTDKWIFLVHMFKCERAVVGFGLVEIKKKMCETLAEI